MICPVTGTRCEYTGCTVYIDGRCGQLPAAPVDSSGTPRVDEADRVYQAWLDSDPLSGDIEPYNGWDIARTLERDLSQVTEFASAWHHAVDAAATIIDLPTKLPNPTTFLTELRDHDDALRASVSRLTRELDEARKDAERYRFLRENGRYRMDRFCDDVADYYSTHAAWILMNADKLDAAIDTALSGGGGEG